MKICIENEERNEANQKWKQYEVMKVAIWRSYENKYRKKYVMKYRKLAKWRKAGRKRKRGES